VATFTVWKFDSATGAEDALSTLERLQSEELVTVVDAAVVTWPDGAKKPKTKQLHNLTGAGALGGAFWGFLFGLIFFVPIFGLVAGAAAGAVSGALADVGIDDDFIKQIRERVTEGTSALFLMTEHAVVDRVTAEMEQQLGHTELIHTNLSSEQEAKLREAFGEE